MPAGISSLPPSSFDYDKKNPPAFTIIPRDNFGTTLPILHLNNFTNDDNHNENENSQILSTKLINNEKNYLYSHKRISKSNDHLLLASLQSNQTNPLKKNNKQCKSHDQLNSNEKNFSLPKTKSPMNLSTENFNNILTAKLKKIQEKELINNNNQDEQLNKVEKKQQTPLKKPFITTVKKGEFLMPPPEVAAILGMTRSGDWMGQTIDSSNNNHHPLPRSKFRPLFSFNRRPEVRHSSHNARCQAALKATVDFAVNIVNSTNATTASSFASAARRMAATNNSNNNRLIENDQSLPFGNIMFDRRVVRGSTFASASIIADEQSQAARHAEARRKQLSKKRCEASSRSMMLRLSSPPPVPGRKHEPVQTELYLEELLEKPQESEVATQTDYFLDRPSTPPFCPEKTGIDAETQIGPGDLFDYDAEVQPILEVLVGKTIEQALTEVLEEEEMANIKEQQRRFLELRAAEEAEALRLEQQDRRIREEKDRRLRQHEDALKVQQETEERVAATVLLTGYIAELLPTVLDGLKVSGYLLDEMKSDSEDGFMPWLVKEVRKEMDTMVDSRELLSDIICEIVEKRAEIYRKQIDDYEESEKLITEGLGKTINIDEINEKNDETDYEENLLTDKYSATFSNNSNDV
ncbi:hypothetical protein PV327_010287 [Microctonus hyperodae]|uniref:Radial spoke head protein 3 homolog n=1 Tax=Microctonus hyperodae TaxID=165561 RepID=A0AA39FRK4_MICHY|nr:hypothetical protein PV327_010287 [Microctonus hyperodae]